LVLFPASGGQITSEVGRNAGVVRSRPFLWSWCWCEADILGLLSTMILPAPDPMVHFAFERLLLEQFWTSKERKVVASTDSNNTVFALRDNEVYGGVESRPGACLPRRG
jgi:hypothetical protein